MGGHYIQSILGLGILAVVGCATPQQGRLEGSVLRVPEQCFKYEPFDAEQHQDCKAILGRGTDYFGGLDDVLADMDIKAGPTSVQRWRTGEGKGATAHLRVPDTLIVPQRRYQPGGPGIDSVVREMDTYSLELNIEDPLIEEYHPFDDPDDNVESSTRTENLNEDYEELLQRGREEPRCKIEDGDTILRCNP